MYRLPNIFRVIKSTRFRWADHVIVMEEGRSAFKILTGKPRKQSHLGRPRRRYEDLNYIGINTRNWVVSVQDRDYLRALVNVALKIRWS